MGKLEASDEVNPPSLMKKLREQAKKKTAKVASADVWLEAIIKEVQEDPQSAINKLFINEKFTKFEYILLTLLVQIKEALSKKRRKKTG